MAFADRLKEALINRELSQSELAELSGLAQNTISNYVHGVNAPRTENVTKLAQALDISYRWLLLGEGDMEKAAKSDERVKTIYYTDKDVQNLEVLNLLIKALPSCDLKDDDKVRAFKMLCDFRAETERKMLFPR